MPDTLALYAGSNGPQSGRLAAGQDYTVVGAVITTVSNFAASSLIADYQTRTTTSTPSGNDLLSPFALTTLPRVKDLLFDPNQTILVTGCAVTQGSNSVTGATVPTGSNVVVGQQISGWGIPVGTTILAITGSTFILSQNATETSTGQTLTVINQTPAYDAILTRMINYATNYINNEYGRTSFVQQTYVNDTYSIENIRRDTVILRNLPVFPASDGVHITSFQYRAGTPSSPSWTDFLPDQYELINPRTDPVSGQIWYPSGMIRVYGVLPTISSNMIRACWQL